MTNYVVDTSSTNYSAGGGGLDSLRAYAIQINAGTFASSGSTVSISKVYALTAAPQTFALTGYDIEIKEIYTLSQAPDNTNAFTLTAQTCNFIGTKKVSFAPGAFTYTDLIGVNQDAVTRFAISYGIFATQTGPFVLEGGSPPLVFNEVFTLPAVSPTKREFVPASFSFHATRSLNGHTVRKLNANVEGGAELRLGFQNLADADVLTLLETYNRTYGNYFYLTVPEETFAGADATLKVYFKLNNTQMKWAFTEAPTIDTTAPGYHDVSFSLRSRITSLKRFALSTAEVEPEPEPIVYGSDWLELTTDMAVTAAYTSRYLLTTFGLPDLATDFDLSAAYTYASNVLVLGDLWTDYEVSATYTYPSNVLVLGDLVTDFEITSIV